MKVEKWTGDEKVSVNDILAVLNDALKKDPEAMTALVNARVNCNEALENHDSIQVGTYDDKGEFASEGQTKVGLLGLLNGLVGVDKNVYGPISATVDDDGNVTAFSLTDTDAVSAKKEEKSD